jgi:hypothetical protein
VVDYGRLGKAPRRHRRPFPATCSHRTTFEFLGECAGGLNRDRATGRQGRKVRFDRCAASPIIHRGKASPHSMTPGPDWFLASCSIAALRLPLRRPSHKQNLELSSTTLTTADPILIPPPLSPSITSKQYPLTFIIHLLQDPLTIPPRAPSREIIFPHTQLHVFVQIYGRSIVCHVTLKF